uniref:IgGFc_binding domain-containing protein n=1 Tax=Rhabditophanes sp. KR3021 TaxID=114890 RepID=A0AC35UE94_9BILA
MKVEFILSIIASVLLLSSAIKNTENANLLGSEGTYFVASFAQYRPTDDPNRFQIELVYIPSGKDNATVSTSWYSLKNSSSVSYPYFAENGVVSMQQFSYSDIIDDSYAATGSVAQIQDPRIIIISDKPIKVIARIYDIITGRGDAYDLISENIVGNEYEVNLPRSNNDGFQIIHVFGSNLTSPDVQYIHFIDGVQLENGTITLAQTLGAPQNVFTVPFDGSQHSYYFKGTSFFYITAAVTNVDIMYYTTGNSDGLGNKIFEYVAHQPVPLSPYDCKHLFNDPTDIRMTTIQNAVSVYMGAGALNCGNTFPLYTLNDNRNQRSNGFGPDDSFAVPGTLGLVTDFNTTVGTTAFGIQVTHVQAPWARLGTMRDAHQKPSGLFIHYTPESTQFVTGDTTFYTFNDEDMIEVYGDNNVGTNEFLLDNQPVPIINVKSIPITIFKQNFYAFTIVIPIGGLHTFSSRGRYVAYVMGRNVFGKAYLYGYTASYNTSKLTSYWAADPTTTTPISDVTSKKVTDGISMSTIAIMTTTSASTMSSSLILTLITAFVALIIRN